MKADIVLYDKDMNSMNTAEITSSDPTLIATYVSGDKMFTYAGE